MAIRLTRTPQKTKRRSRKEKKIDNGESHPRRRSEANTISVVRATGGAGRHGAGNAQGNGLNGPIPGAFDGERILFTNQGSAETRVSLWKTADLTAIGNIVMSNEGQNARGACSDGINFYISARDADGRPLLRL